MKKLVNAWLYKCPRCMSSPLFIEPLDLKNPLNMHSQCGHCKQSFEPEPGFYYGAMFVSYTLSILLLLPLSLALVFMFDWTVNGAMALVIFLGALFFLRILRFSRALWINLLVKYDSNYKKSS